MKSYGSMWRDGKQEVGLPLHRQRGPGDREAGRAELVEGVRERPERSRKAVEGAQTGNGLLQRFGP